MKHKTIYNDLEMMKAVATYFAQNHNCNYNIVIMNPDPEGNFNEEYGSTYEFVGDSFFEEDDQNVILLHKTNDLMNIKEEDHNAKDNSLPEEKSDNTNDKRYTEPFEDDGAYAD